mmetsp:Transcript_6507/g.7441  ORF Transcript_6507/g.7441 Transcript_6507/m.7441 type:complete len:163 (+) Transcript_6507:170-658(+)
MAGIKEVFEKETVPTGTTDDSSLDRVLSVENRSVNFEKIADDGDMSLLELGKAWLENAPAASLKEKEESPASEKHLPPPATFVVKKPPSIFKPRLKPGIATTTRKRDIVNSTPAVSQNFLLACHLSYMRRSRRKLREYSSKRYERYSNRLRSLNLEWEKPVS